MGRPLPVLVLAVSFLAACGGDTAEPWRGEGATIEITVHDMHCSGCELEVETALEQVPGVQAVTARWEDNRVTVTLADAVSRETAIQALREAIHRNGRQVVGEDAIPADHGSE